jgi:hypothetical protein
MKLVQLIFCLVITWTLSAQSTFKVVDKNSLKVVPFAVFIDSSNVTFYANELGFIYTVSPAILVNQTEGYHEKLVLKNDTIFLRPDVEVLETVDISATKRTLKIGKGKNRRMFPSTPFFENRELLTIIRLDSTVSSQKIKTLKLYFSNDHVVRKNYKDATHAKIRVKFYTGGKNNLELAHTTETQMVQLHRNRKVTFDLEDEKLIFGHQIIFSLEFLGCYTENGERSEKQYAAIRPKLVVRDTTELHVTNFFWDPVTSEMNDWFQKMNERSKRDENVKEGRLNFRLETEVYQ